MNCQRCHKPNPEGKSYCGDCGAALDPNLVRLDEVVRTQVKEAIDERFRDQKLIAVETSEQIVNRVYGWAKLFAFFVGIPLALILIGLNVAGIEKYSDIKRLVNNIDNQVKPRIEQARASAELAQHEAEEAQSKAEEAKNTIVIATDQVKKQVGSATQVSKSVQQLSDRISESERKVSQQMSTSGQRVDSRVLELDRKIDAATKDIAEQEKKLASTNELVKSIFSKGTTEYFDTKTNSAKVEMMPFGKNTAVFMLLKAAPIAQTLEIKWRVASQPRDSYSILTNNLVFFNWGDPANTLKQFPLEVTYIPDPTATAEPFNEFIVRNGHTYAGPYQLPDLVSAQPQP